MKWPQYYCWLAGNCKRSRAGVVPTQDGGWEMVAIGVEHTGCAGPSKKGGRHSLDLHMAVGGQALPKNKRRFSMAS